MICRMEAAWKGQVPVNGGLLALDNRFLDRHGDMAGTVGRHTSCQSINDTWIGHVLKEDLAQACINAN